MSSTPNSNLKKKIVKHVKFLHQENAVAHDTYCYDSAPDFLIVRRGQNFKIKLILNQKFPKLLDDLYLVFQVHDDLKPNVKYGTLIKLKIKENNDNETTSNNWELKIHQININVLTLHVKPAANCPVTKWKLKIQKGPDSKPEFYYELTKPIYILFNPRCVEDEVYMEDQNHRSEFVRQDTTLIYQGTKNSGSVKAWRLGQFEENILECIYYLVDNVAKIRPRYRGDPIVVSRALSSAVNAFENHGVVRGNWAISNSWTGSTEILQEYYETKEPVNYGQCWVFAGVLGTALRALGIPAKLVTTGNCAHDTYGTLMLDEIVDETGKRLSDLEVDHMWNYHVWNEAWMKRNDLNSSGKNYDGWQALDGTPQRESDGMHRLGPAPLKAIKYGEILEPYDVAYVYAEVNADIVTWKYIDLTTPYKFLRANTTTIGNLITSKAVGQRGMADVSMFYKFPEKTKEERDIMEKALKLADLPYSDLYLEEIEKLKVNLFADRTAIGQSLPIHVNFSNASEKEFLGISGYLNISSIMYNGKGMNFIKQVAFSIRVGPQENTSAEMQVSFDDYYPKLFDQEILNVNCLLKITGTNKEYFVEENFRLSKPTLSLNFNELPVVNKPVTVEVSMTNTLPIPLSNGNVHINGTMIPKPITLKMNEIKPGEDFHTTFEYLPLNQRFSMDGIISAKFTSTELENVDGFVSFTVGSTPKTEVYDVVSLNDLFCE